MDAREKLLEKLVQLYKDWEQIEMSTLSYVAGDDLLMRAQIDVILQECRKSK